MNKLVYSALALTIVSGPGLATENEWSSLDQEIESLSSSLASQNSTGPMINGWVRASWRDASNTEESVLDGAPVFIDRQGFFLDTARIEISGDAGNDYSYKVSFELSDSELEGSSSDDNTFGNPGQSSGVSLQDAYGTFRVADGFNARLGRFKIPFLRSAVIADNRLLFLDRTALGEIFDMRDVGAMLFGNFDTLYWYLSGQNGATGTADDDYLLAGRLVANLLGNGAGQVEGAYGAGDDTRLSIAAAAADEGALKDGFVWAVEAAFAQGPFSVAGELVDFDNGDSVGGTDTFNVGNPFRWHGADPRNVADTTPWSATASYLFSDQWEVGLRYEDMDDTGDTRRYGAAVNHYVAGHDIKWTAQFVRTENDAFDDDIDEIGIGLGVSF